MKLTRRQKLILQYGLISFALVLAVSIAVLWSLGKAKPYTAGGEVEGITSELNRTLPGGHPEVQFVDATATAGLEFHHFPFQRSTQLPEDMGSGASWGDYDNDGDPDLYVCNISVSMSDQPHQSASGSIGNRLFRNNGNGTFEDVTSQANLVWEAISMASAWADFDGDSFLDLLVTSYGTNKLYRNRGDGTFEDVSSRSGLDRNRGFWTGVNWGDYDKDGDLDAYICGYVQYDYRPEDRRRTSGQYKTVVPYTLNPSSYDPERNLLFRNDGSGKFTEVAKISGVDNPQGRSLSACWVDFNQDGFPDLYVANDISDNSMYMNMGNGKFSDVSEASWVSDYRGAMGLGVGDWDNDGDMDIFITHWIAQENALFDNLLVPLGKNKDNGFVRFTDLADREGLGQIALDYIGWGTSFFDFDNDGRRDLLVANGSTFQDEKDPTKLIPMRNLLFWNKGKDGFFEVGEASGEVFSRLAVGRGAAFADYDLDGDQDAVIVNHGGKILLLRNDGGNRKRWIQVDARDHFGDPAIHARIEVVGGGRKQVDEIGAQSSYLSQNEAVAHFGLDLLDQVDSIRVVFISGKIAQVSNVSSNQRIRIDEPE